MVFQCPRLEAVKALGSLVCFPNHYHDLPLLYTDMDRSTIKPDVLKVGVSPNSAN